MNTNVGTNVNTNDNQEPILFFKHLTMQLITTKWIPPLLAMKIILAINKISMNTMTKIVIGTNLSQK